ADAGKALASVGDKGATNISGLTFTNDDPDKVMKEAKAEAIKDAKSKAEDLAKSLGVRLVKVVGYYDNSQGGYPIMADSAGFNGVSMMKATAPSAPTVPTGENKVTANVTVTYEIR
ncbi:MAG: SIMPL domain-containing protein, partial [Minisyncoccia bacterium]